MKHFAQRVMLLLVLCFFALSGCSLFGGESDDGLEWKDWSKVGKSECGKFGKGACIMANGLLCEGDVYLYIDLDLNLLATLSMSKPVCSSYAEGEWYSSSELQAK